MEGTTELPVEAADELRTAVFLGGGAGQGCIIEGTTELQVEAADEMRISLYLVPWVGGPALEPGCCIQGALCQGLPRLVSGYGQVVVCSVEQDTMDMTTGPHPRSQPRVLQDIMDTTTWPGPRLQPRVLQDIVDATTWPHPRMQPRVKPGA
jgi:hypothetical protein